MPHAHASRPARLAGAAGISIFGHALLLVAAASLLPCSLDTPKRPPSEFAVSVVPVAAPAPASLEPEHPEPPEERALTHVAISAPETEATPDDPLVSDRVNRSVEHETVSRDGRLGSPQVAVVSASAARRGDADGEGERTVARALPGDHAGAASVGPRPGPLPDDQSAAAVLPTDLDPFDAESLGEGRPDALSPRGSGLDLTVFNIAAPQPLVVGGDDMAYLDVDDGDRTLVNSARSLYWSFFERMRRQLVAEWDPAGVYRRNDPSGQLYRRIDRLTVLDVLLGPDGRLVGASVVRASGLDFLDDEALRSMRQAAPFPNVPEGLKDESGQVRIRYSFILTFDGRARVRRLPL